MSQPNNSPDDFIAALKERQANPSKRGIPLPDDFASRPFGLFLLGFCAFLFWKDTWSHITAARAHEPLLFYSSKWIFVQPLLLVHGLIYTIFGDSASKVLGPTTKPSKYGWALLAVVLPASFYYAHWVENLLRQLGYSV